MTGGDYLVEKKYFGESKNIEFKREIPKKHEKFLKDIIAFSNCTGGRVILGIEDITNVVYGIGDQNPFKLSDDVSNMISDACTPQIEPEISIQTVENKTILVIDVVPGRFRPYYLKNMGKEMSAYIRINGTSRPADKRKLQELELEGQRISYDSLQDIGEEYNEKKVIDLCHTMREIAIKSFHMDEDKITVKEMTIEKLEDLGLLCRVGKDLYPTHAFSLMTDNRMKYAKIQCALFKGTTRDVFIDKKEYNGPIYKQIEEAYQFVLKHINLGAEIEGLLRKDVYELPIKAIREMIANAVVHRSYLDDSCIQVSIYEDRIEVVSPGMLYGGMDMETAKSGRSRCRNAAIAEAFQYMHIVEAWGTGIPRILNQCKEYGLPEPLFEEFGDGIKVTMFRKQSSDGQKVSNDGQKVSSDDQKVSSDGQKVSSDGQKVSSNDRKVSSTFEIYRNILEAAAISNIFISNIEKIFVSYGTEGIFKQADIMDELGCSKSKATNVMNVMRKAQIIEKVKGFGNGKYKFVDVRCGEE